MLKCEQKLVILSFKEEITEVPAGWFSSEFGDLSRCEQYRSICFLRCTAQSMLFQRYSTKWVYFYISFIFMMFHWCFHQNTSVKTQKYLRAHNLNNLVSCCYITFSEHTLKKQVFFDTHLHRCFWIQIPRRMCASEARNRFRLMKDWLDGDLACILELNALHDDEGCKEKLP